MTTSKKAIISAKIAFICYLLIALMGTAFGLRYLFASQIMPYHLVAIGSDWIDLSLELQIMLLGLIRGAGLGFLTTSLSIGILLFIPFRRGEEWSRWTIFIISLIFFGTMLFLTLIIKFNTDASPPYILNIIGLALSIMGFLFSLRFSKLMKRSND